MFNIRSSFTGRIRCAAALLCVVAATLVVPACAGGGGGAGGGSPSIGELERPSIGPVEPGDPVRGEVAVTWQNLNPRAQPLKLVLVNESSEAGKMLRSGKANSSEIRVLSDVDMGTLIGQLKERGFYENATKGIGIENIPNVGGRRGIVVLHDNGIDYGLMLVPGAGGTPLPAAYRDCKALVLRIHGMLPGYDLIINADPDRVFSAPPIRMHRR